MDIQRPESVKKAKQRKQYMLGAIAAIIVVAVSVGLSQLRPAAPTVERATVWVDTVKRGPMVRQVRGLGTLVPVDEARRWVPASTQGRVERINPSTEPGTRTINIYVSLPNEDALLRAGMFARVALVTSVEAEVPALPISALRTENGTTFVWTIRDGKIARRLVETGRRDERSQLVEVTGGLTPEDRVLATKFDNLKDGLAAKVLSGIGEARVAGKDTPRTADRAN